MKKKIVKKLTLSKESLVRLDPSDLREVAGGVSLRCTTTDYCTDGCSTSYAC